MRRPSSCIAELSYSKSSAFTRGILNLGGGHQLFAEISTGPRPHYLYTGTVATGYDADIDVSRVPAFAGSALNGLDADDEERIITVRTRMRGRPACALSELVSNTMTRASCSAPRASLSGWDYEGRAAQGHSTKASEDFLTAITRAISNDADDPRRASSQRHHQPVHDVRALRPA